MLKQAKVIRHVTPHPNLVTEVQGRGHGVGFKTHVSIVMDDVAAQPDEVSQAVKLALFDDISMCVSGFT